MSHDIHPEGMFVAEIEDHGFATSNNGTPYLGVTFVTCIGDGNETGRITGYFYLSDAAAEYTVQKIRVMGYEGDDLRDLAKTPPILQGKAVKILVKHEEFEGKVRAKVNGVFPEDYEPGLKKDENAAANVLRFNALLKKVKATTPAPQSTERKKAVGNEDDVPF